MKYAVMLLPHSDALYPAYPQHLVSSQKHPPTCTQYSPENETINTNVVDTHVNQLDYY